MIKSHTFLSDAVPLTLFHVHMYSILILPIGQFGMIIILQSPHLPLFLVYLPLYSPPTDNYFICPFRSPCDAVTIPFRFPSILSLFPSPNIPSPYYLSQFPLFFTPSPSFPLPHSLSPPSFLRYPPSFPPSLSTSLFHSFSLPLRPYITLSPFQFLIFPPSFPVTP